MRCKITYEKAQNIVGKYKELKLPYLQWRARGNLVTFYENRKMNYRGNKRKYNKEHVNKHCFEVQKRYRH